MLLFCHKLTISQQITSFSVLIISSHIVSQPLQTVAFYNAFLLPFGHKKRATWALNSIKQSNIYAAGFEDCFTLTYFVTFPAFNAFALIQIL